jgi:hypothetical protein
MRSFYDEGGDGCLVEMGAIIGVICGRGSVHPVKSYLMFNGCYSKFLSTWYLSVHFLEGVFESGTLLLVKQLGRQSCIHCKDQYRWVSR